MLRSWCTLSDGKHMNCKFCDVFKVSRTYPPNAVLVQAGCKIVSGHVGGISCIRFTADDKHVVSIGKGDRAVFIWMVDKDEEAASLRPKPQ